MVPGRYDPVYEEGGQDYPLPYVRWTENQNMGHTSSRWQIKVRGNHGCAHRRAAHQLGAATLNARRSGPKPWSFAGAPGRHGLRRLPVPEVSTSTRAIHPRRRGSLRFACKTVFCAIVRARRRGSLPKTRDYRSIAGRHATQATFSSFMTISSF
jgi:hypothetical protein